MAGSVAGAQGVLECDRLPVSHCPRRLLRGDPPARGGVPLDPPSRHVTTLEEHLGVDRRGDARLSAAGAASDGPMKIGLPTIHGTGGVPGAPGSFASTR